MENTREVLAAGVLQSQDLLKRYLAGFDDKTLVAQPPGLPNHLAWTLGHLAVTMGRAMEKLGAKSDDALPPEQFVTGDDRAREGEGRGGPLGRFDTQSVSFGSKPVNDPTLYPDLARSIAIFDSACERLAEFVRSCPNEALARSVAWGGGTTLGWQLVQRMAFHNGVHTGQIADLRRALSMKSIFG